MTTQAKKIFAVAGLVLALLLLYFVVFAQPETKELTRALGDDEQDDATAGGFPLKLGSRGDNVRAWQGYVYDQTGKPAKDRSKYTDGIFGPITEADTKKVIGTDEVSFPMFIDRVAGVASLSGAQSGGKALQYDALAHQAFSH